MSLVYTNVGLQRAFELQNATNDNVDFTISSIKIGKFEGPNYTPTPTTERMLTQIENAVPGQTRTLKSYEFTAQSPQTSYVIGTQLTETSHEYLLRLEYDEPGDFEFNEIGFFLDGPGSNETLFAIQVLNKPQQKLVRNTAQGKEGNQIPLRFIVNYSATTPNFHVPSTSPYVKEVTSLADVDKSRKIITAPAGEDDNVVQRALFFTNNFNNSVDMSGDPDVNKRMEGNALKSVSHIVVPELKNVEVSAYNTTSSAVAGVPAYGIEIDDTAVASLNLPSSVEPGELILQILNGENIKNKVFAIQSLGMRTGNKLRMVLGSDAVARLDEDDIVTTSESTTELPATRIQILSIPSPRLTNTSSGGGGTGLTQSQVDARVQFGVYDWAERDNMDLVDSDKLGTNEPTGNETKILEATATTKRWIDKPATRSDDQVKTLAGEKIDEEIPENRRIPAGGTDGQILAKDSNTDYDTEWINAPKSGQFAGFYELPEATNNLSLGTPDGNGNLPYVNYYIKVPMRNVNKTIQLPSSTGPLTINIGDSYTIARVNDRQETPSVIEATGDLTISTPFTNQQFNPYERSVAVRVNSYQLKLVNGGNTSSLNSLDNETQIITITKVSDSRWEITGENGTDDWALKRNRLSTIPYNKFPNSVAQPNVSEETTAENNDVFFFGDTSTGGSVNQTKKITKPNLINTLGIGKLASGVRFYNTNDDISGILQTNTQANLLNHHIIVRVQSTDRTIQLPSLHASNISNGDGYIITRRNGGLSNSQGDLIINSHTGEDGFNGLSGSGVEESINRRQIKIKSPGNNDDDQTIIIIRSNLVTSAWSIIAESGNVNPLFLRKNSSTTETRLLPILTGATEQQSKVIKTDSTGMTYSLQDDESGTGGGNAASWAEQGDDSAIPVAKLGNAIKSVSNNPTAISTTPTNPAIDTFNNITYTNTTNNLVLRLPPIPTSSQHGRVIFFRKTNATAINITLTPHTTNSINRGTAGSNFVISGVDEGDLIALMTDSGSNWEVIINDPYIKSLIPANTRLLPASLDGNKLIATDGSGSIVPVDNTLSNLDSRITTNDSNITTNTTNITTNTNNITSNTAAIATKINSDMVANFAKTSMTNIKVPGGKLNIQQGPGIDVNVTGDVMRISLASRVLHEPRITRFDIIGIDENNPPPINTSFGGTGITIHYEVENPDQLSGDLLITMQTGNATAVPIEVTNPDPVSPNPTNFLSKTATTAQITIPTTTATMGQTYRFRIYGTELSSGGADGDIVESIILLRIN